MSESDNVRRRAFEFRQLVALVLTVLDVTAQPRPESTSKKLHERLQEPRDPSDIVGVAGWLLRTYTATQRDLSGALDAAKLAADEAGIEHHATIWKRPGRAAADAYVVLSLTEFGKLMAELKKNSEQE